MISVMNRRRGESVHPIIICVNVINVGPVKAVENRCSNSMKDVVSSTSRTPCLLVCFEQKQYAKIQARMPTSFSYFLVPKSAKLELRSNPLFNKGLDELIELFRNRSYSG